MPKLKESPEAIAQRKIRATIAAHCIEQDVTRDELAQAARMSNGTMRRRMASPLDFTLGELLAMNRKLKFEPDELCAFIGIKGSKR